MNMKSVIAILAGCVLVACFLAFILPGKGSSKSNTHKNIALMQIQKGVIQVENYKTDTQTQNTAWKILGPGGGGAQYIPTVSPFDPDTALVACDMTGSYITHDGGKTWKELNFKVQAGAFAFDPVNKGVVYAGGTGLYRSEDNGDKWRLIFPDPAHVTGEIAEGDHAEHAFVTNDGWPGGKVKAIAVDPAQPDHIFIGINTGNRHADGINTGEILFFYSKDRGASWKQVFTVNCSMDYTSYARLYIDPSSPVENRRLFIFTDSGMYQTTTDGFSLKAFDIERLLKTGTISDVTWGLDKTTGKPVFYLLCPSKAAGGKFLSNVYRSSDYCKTWQEITSGLDADQAGGQTRKFTRIAACMNDASVVYLGCSEPTWDNPKTSSSLFYFGVFKSDNGGDSWKWVLKIGDENPENRKLGWIEKDYATDWGGAPFNLGISPANPDICYASDWGTAYRTADGGKTWEQLYCDELPDETYTSRGLDVTNVYGVHFDPFNKEHIVISSTDVGLFESANGGASWKHSQNGVPSQWTNSCYWVVFDPEVKGKAWSVWSDCHDLPRPKMISSGKVNKCVGGVCKTDDGMESWKKSNSGIPENCAMTHLILDPASPVGKRTLYAAGFGGGVFKSVDDGATWTLKNNGIKGNLNAWNLVIHPDGTLYLLVARGLDNGRPVDGALYKSKNGAESWEIVKLPSGVNFPNDLCIDPQNPQRMYIACWPQSTTEGETGGGLYVTEDGCRSWSLLYNAASHVYGVTVDPQKTSTIFIGTFEGSVLRSDDGGKNWARLGGYNFKWAKTPILDPYNKGMLYVTTFGSSVWYGPDTGIENAFEDIYPLK